MNLPLVIAYTTAVDDDWSCPFCSKYPMPCFHSVPKVKIKRSTPWLGFREWKQSFLRRQESEQLEKQQKQEAVLRLLRGGQR